jgi:hypothetical protein
MGVRVRFADDRTGSRFFVGFNCVDVNTRTPQRFDNALGVSRTDKADENDISTKLPEYTRDVASLPARLDDGLTAALYCRWL